MERIFLDVANLGGEGVGLGENRLHFGIFQSGWHLKVILGKGEIVFRAFPASSLDLAELAMTSGAKFAFARIGQLCRRDKVSFAQARRSALEMVNSLILASRGWKMTISTESMSYSPSNI